MDVVKILEVEKEVLKELIWYVDLLVVNILLNKEVLLILKAVILLMWVHIL